MKFISHEYANDHYLSTFWTMEQWPSGQGAGFPCSKPLGGSKVDSAFHPSEVGKMSTRNFWELNGKK